MRSFVLLAQSRSGSSAIRQEIDNHPEVVCYGELARRDPDLRPGDEPAEPLHRFARTETGVVSEARFVEWVRYLDGLAPDAAAVGSKILLGYLSGIETGLDALKAAGCSVVYLKRENLLRRSISGIVAQKTGVFNSQHPPEPGRRFRIAPRPVISRMKRSADLLPAVEGGLKASGVRHIVVAYEDFCSDRERFHASVAAFLGVAAVVPEPSTFAVRVPERLPDLIENYEEVAAAVTEAGFGRYLD